MQKNNAHCLEWELVWVTVVIVISYKSMFDSLLSDRKSFVQSIRPFDLVNYSSFIVRKLTISCQLFILLMRWFSCPPRCYIFPSIIYHSSLKSAPKTGQCATSPVLPELLIKRSKINSGLLHCFGSGPSRQSRMGGFFLVVMVVVVGAPDYTCWGWFGLM